MQFSETKQFFDIGFGDTQTIHGKDGADGKDGVSAYEIAVRNGFEGSESEWLESLHGKDGQDGKDGTDAHTPVKGVDYYTEVEKTALVEEICVTVTGDIESALDGIINIQNELLDVATVTIYKTTDPNGEKSTYQYKKGMTWAVWVASEYNTDGYFVVDVWVYSADGNILGYAKEIEEGEIMLLESISTRDSIDPDKYFYCYD